MAVIPLTLDSVEFVDHLDTLGVPIWTEVYRLETFTRPRGWQQLDATGNSERIAHRPGGAALCATMGGPIAVVDVDTKNGADVQKIQAALDGIGVHVYADILTPSGGRHLYVAGHPDLPTVHARADREGLTGYPGVEILSHGTNVFLPGTARRKYGGAGYLILDDQLAILADTTDGDPDSADALVGWVAEHRTAQPEQFDPVDPWDGKTPPGPREHAYLQAAVRRQAEQIAAMGPDSGRNTACFNAGLMIGNYQAGAGLQIEPAIDQLLAAAQTCGLIAEDGEKAVRASIASGIRLGRNRPRAVPDLLSLPAKDTPKENPDDPGDQLPPSWSPIVLDAILDGTWKPEEPRLMPRSDRHCLLYPGRVHSFHGESESGKSFVVQAETARILTDPAAGRVLYIDYESDQAAVVGRLLSLGAPPEQIRARLDYIRPESSPYQLPAEREAFNQILSQPYTLVALDGVTEALVTYGAGSLDNDEITAWFRLIPRLIAQKTGAAVTLIDHVTKNGESRGRFAIGGQAKLAALDGAAYSVEITEPLGRGMRGIISLRIAKDRPGAIRPYAGPFRTSDRTQEAAHIVIDSTDPDTIRVTLETPEGAAETEKRFRPTYLMERVSDALKNSDEPLTQRQVTNLVPGRSKNIRMALQTLIEEGHVSTSIGPRRAILHTLDEPFSELTDRPRPSASHRVPDAVSDDVPSTASGTHSTSVPAGRTHDDPTDPDETNDRVPLDDADYSDCNQCGKRTLDQILDANHGICFSCRTIQAGL